LIFLGIQLGNNLELVDKYLSEYSRIILAITAVIIIIVLVRFLMKKKKGK